MGVWMPLLLFLKGLFRMENQEQDLTVGSVPGKLIRFAVPLLGANLLQSLYSIVDMLVVGRVVGKTGLAAISNASMISFIINSVCVGVTMGGTVLAAQYKGAGDEQGQKETIPLQVCLAGRSGRPLPPWRGKIWEHRMRKE